MSFQIRWLGHGSWSMKIGDTNVLLDPFIDENPSAPCKAADLDADYVLVSHGHFDHVADVAAIANRTNATVIAIYEIAEWFGKHHGVQNVVGMNIGGGIDLPFGRVTMTHAIHSSQLPDGSDGGNPAGFVVASNSQKRVYFACDTALFSDMALVASQPVDLAVLPIGDLFTMGPQDAVTATKFIQPKRVVPAHYNTWPPIEQDAASWAELIRQNTESEPVVLSPGDTIEV